MPNETGPAPNPLAPSALGPFERLRSIARTVTDTVGETVGHTDLCGAQVPSPSRHTAPLPAAEPRTNDSDREEGVESIAFGVLVDFHKVIVAWPTAELASHIESLKRLAHCVHTLPDIANPFSSQWAPEVKGDVLRIELDRLYRLLEDLTFPPELENCSYWRHFCERTARFLERPPRYGFSTDGTGT